MSDHPQTEDLFHTAKGVAVLVTCVVQTLSESEPTFQERFLNRIGEAYYELRDNSEMSEVRGLELLSWTRELLTGWDRIHGQRKPFLGGR